MKRVVLTNAFSINMLSQTTSVSFTHCHPSVVNGILDDAEGGFVSAVGHADTAALFSKELGVSVPVNRITVEFDSDTTLVVGQYKGPRLPEGCSELPDGATIEWWLVNAIDWEEVRDFYEGRG